MNSSSQNKVISINELWRFFNRSANLFCITGADGYLKQVNPHFFEILGFSEEKLLSTPYMSFIHEEDREYSAAQSARVRKETPSIQFKNRILDSKDSYRWISWTATFMEDEDSVYLIGQDHTETHIVEEKLKLEKQGKHKMVLEATLTGQEKEKIEIGRELHDNINQILATAIMYQEMALNKDFDSREMIVKSREAVQAAIDEIRCLSKSLVGPDNRRINLFDCMRELVDTVLRNTKISVEFDFSDESEGLPVKVKLMIFRITQEQINNILKHADATKISVRLELNNEYLVLQIKDDGKGFTFNKKTNGIGLKNIRSRIEIFEGFLEIITAPNCGCSLNIRIPTPMVCSDAFPEE